MGLPISHNRVGSAERAPCSGPASACTDAARPREQNDFTARTDRPPPDAWGCVLEQFMNDGAGESGCSRPGYLLRRTNIELRQFTPGEVFDHLLPSSSEGPSRLSATWLPFEWRAAFDGYYRMAVLEWRRVISSASTTARPDRSAHHVGHTYTIWSALGRTAPRRDRAPSSTALGILVCHN